MKTSIKPPKPPAHISAESKKWFASVLDDYALEPHEVKLLIMACEAFDRATSARETIAECGAYFTDRFGSPRKHPAVERSGSRDDSLR